VIEYKDKSMNAINIDSSELAIIEAILYDNNE
jgi:hypothetical protein